MTKEQKDLLKRVICAMLPYGVKATTTSNGWNDIYTITGYKDDRIYLDCPVYDEGDDEWLIESVKPYLRPMSSMTEEEFESMKEYSGLKYEQLDLASYQNGTYKCLDFYLSEVPSYVVILVFDWLNSYHFDYCGLIEQCLAIAVTEENNPYKD